MDEKIFQIAVDWIKANIVTASGLAGKIAKNPVCVRWAIETATGYLPTAEVLFRALDHCGYPPVDDLGCRLIKFGNSNAWLAYNGQKPSAEDVHRHTTARTAD
jgi:hypothetical protein